MCIRVVQEITEKEICLDSVLPELDIKNCTKKQAYNTFKTKCVILEMSQIPKYRDLNLPTLLSLETGLLYVPSPNNKTQRCLISVAYNKWTWQPFKSRLHEVAFET